MRYFLSKFIPMFFQTDYVEHKGTNETLFHVSWWQWHGHCFHQKPFGIRIPGIS